MSDIHPKARLYIQCNGVTLDLDVPAGEIARIDINPQYLTTVPAASVIARRWRPRTVAAFFATASLVFLSVLVFIQHSIEIGRAQDGNPPKLIDFDAPLPPALAQHPSLSAPVSLPPQQSQSSTDPFGLRTH